MQLQMVKPNGVILWAGNSLLNAEPIIVLAIGLKTESKNTKTGALIQTYILPDNGQTPTEAWNSGADASVCGDCIHRKDGWGTCYVNLGQGPHAVHGAWLRGNYPIFNPTHLEFFKDSIVRLGAYGDPAAVPIGVWEQILGVAAGWTGYTHQWKRCDKTYQRYLMASCETVRQRRKAMREGWKAFRVRNEDEPLEQGEFECPASKEAGARLTCDQCLACRGGTWTGQATPSIVVHGAHFKVARFTKMQRRMRNKKSYRKLVA